MSVMKLVYPALVLAAALLTTPALALDHKYCYCTLQAPVGESPSEQTAATAYDPCAEAMCAELVKASREEDLPHPGLELDVQERGELRRGDTGFVHHERLNSMQAADGMSVFDMYWMTTAGNTAVPLHMGLDPTKRYLFTGGLTGKSSDDYAQIYISKICTLHPPDLILCELEPDDPEEALLHNKIVRILESTVWLTVKLKSHGGWARAEGVVYLIP